MASSAAGTLVTGAVRDIASCAANAAPHLDTPGGGSQRATQFRKFLRQRTFSLGWTARAATLQDASKPMPPARVLQALQPAFDGSCGINLRRVLPAVSAHARWCRRSAGSVVPAARAVGSARRMTLERECALCVAHGVAIFQEDVNVVSVIGMYFM